MHAPVYRCCLLLTTLVLAGCGSVPPNASIDSTPSPGGSAIAIADRGFGVRARSWVDSNGNGTWDVNEVPLAGVTLVVLGDQRSQPSDATGFAGVAFIGGCEAEGMEAKAAAESPLGFTFTTPQTLTVTLQPQRPEGGVTPMVEFGFQPTR